MKKMITNLYTGLLIALFVLTVGNHQTAKAQSAPIKPVYCDSVVSYFLKIDTGIRRAGGGYQHAGYLRIGLSGVNLTVDNLKDEYAMWRIDSIPTGSIFPTYVFINQKTTDTMRFSIPAAPDTLAIINRTGPVRDWTMQYSVFEDGRPETFRWEHPVDNPQEDGLQTYIFNLTLGKGGMVMLSSTASLNATELYPTILFTPERVISSPKPDKYYRLKVDTAGMANTPPYFLCADTLIRYDSLTVADTAIRRDLQDDLSLWKFVADTIVCDTTYFRLYNKGTDSLLAFNAPPSADTVAYVTNAGEIGRLYQWRLPFFAEDTLGLFMARDTSAKRDYYLGLNDTIVTLFNQPASDCKPLRFVVEEDGYAPVIPDSSIVDTTQVYKVKYINGTYAGQYLADILGDTIHLDSVYAHIPDGQFIVDRNNRYRLISRSTGKVETGHVGDSLQKVVVGGVERPNQYTNRRVNSLDTFEIVPITYGNIASYRMRTHLGYKYMPPEELNNFIFSFSCKSPDSLKGRLMSYDRADSLVKLSGTGDASFFFLKVANGITVDRATSIGGMPSLRQSCYEFSAYNDTTLYLSADPEPQTPNIKMDHHSKTPFYLKESNEEGFYYLVETTARNDQSGLSGIRKAVVDSTGQFKLVRIDSTAMLTLSITASGLEGTEPPDTFDYLKRLPEGPGFYEFTTLSPGRYQMAKLSKNYSHYATLAKEGESMLRSGSGSYTKYDLRLWVDTASNPSYNPLRPSFYIVKEEKEEKDTIREDTYTSLTGYFLHVMDSASTDYKVPIDGKYYKRVNFVRAKRHASNALLLDNGGATATRRDSVGFAGKNEKAINEYRFYFQETDVAGEYFIVTEGGYLEGELRTRGYLSVSNDMLYIGKRYIDRRENICRVRFDNYVANEVVAPPARPNPEEVVKKITAVGGTGSVSIMNAAGENVTLYNVVGQQLADVILASNNEQITAPRGIVIVKIGRTKTQKVVVK